MTDIIAQLRADSETIQANVSRLKDRLSADQAELEREEKASDALRAVIAMYEQRGAKRDASVPEAPTQQSTSESLRPPSGAPATKKVRMRQEVVTLLKLRGTLHRSRILDHLNSSGIMGGEKNPMGHLAAFLSDNRDTFSPDGRGNFSLRQSEAPEPPPAPNGGAGSADGRNPGSDPGLPFNLQR